MVKFNDFTITSLDTVTAFGLNGALRFILDELQELTIANTQEKVDITGKQGRKINSLKRNKAVTVSGANGLLSGGMLETQTGGQFEYETAAEVEYSDYLVIAGNKAVTTYTAVGAEGAEIIGVYVKDKNGVANVLLEQDADAAEGTFAYNPDTKELTFAGYEDGTEIIAVYKHKVEGNVLTNNSDSYSEKLTLYVDGIAEDKCMKQYHCQFYIPVADFDGNFDLAMGGDQTVHNFEAESLAGTCGNGDFFWKCTIFGVEAA